MKHSFKDGKIIVNSKFYEKAIYNVSNTKISAIFDGMGCVPFYALGDKKSYIGKMSIAIHYNGKPTDFCMPKRVEMIGRKQIVTVYLPDGNKFIIKSFLDKSVNAVFLSYELKGKNNGLLEIALYGALINASIYENQVKTEETSISFSAPINYQVENQSIYFTLDKSCPQIKACLICGEKPNCISKLLNDFNLYEQSCKDEIKTVKVPKTLNEKEKAMFLSCYFCALENYKEKDDFQAFMAGHAYLMPMRTYFRDSYYTVLPMYNGNVDLVKNQIITLSRGISSDGNCPSAVKSDYSAYWGNHFDSPSYLAIMLYDYVRYSKDKDILNLRISNKTVLECASSAIEKLSQYADETCLLYKNGKFNKRDWADEVNRYGYVTYDEILYARALFSLAKLYDILGVDAKCDEYLKWYEKVKTAINTLLWNEDLGYYVNFKNEDYTENNLSIDTVLASIFNIADQDKSIKMLRNMEKTLEVKNNENVKVQDFGVMSVYPFYSNIYSATNRSAQPLHYHNGGNWPYYSALYSYAKRKFGMEYKNALTSWFFYNVKKGNYTPIEYFSPIYKDGSLLQAWSSVAAFVMDEYLSINFFD
ncbi:MAG: hypothetical protein IJX03_00415 [Clostridia bacterium]|nr:hypothetical protein [Clostridia bacterium]